MPTAGDLVTEAVTMMHGYGQTTDRVAILSAPIGPTDLSFTVDTTQGAAVGISAGIVEIDSEQILVTTVNPTTNTCTVANGGRGYGGTTAASHAQYSRIVSQPKFPRFWIYSKMNEVIAGLYPDLFGVSTYTTTITYPQYTYTLPIRPMRILIAEWQDPISQWHPLMAVSIDQFDGTVRLGGGMIGRPLRFVYSVEPQQFTSETDDFVTQTLLPASTADLLPLGVAMKMAPSFDISRAQTNSIEQQARGTVVPPNSGMNLGTYLTREFKDRLQNEASALRAKYPAQIRRKM